jgi:sugar lactone lactonase YvrE
MRFLLNWGIATIAISIVLCLKAESVVSSDIGDGGPGTSATLYGPTGLALDENNLYILESLGKRVRRVNLKTGIITTIAGGDRQCLGAEYGSRKPGCFDWPQRIAVDSLGNIYVTDQGLAAVIKVERDGYSFSTLVARNVSLSSSSSQGRTTKLKWPAGIAIDPLGGLFFVDHTAHTIYRLAFHEDSLEIIAGTGKEGFKGDGGPAREAEFRFPEGLARDGYGNLFVADYGNCRIQRLDAKTGTVTTVTGTDDDGSTCEHFTPYQATLNQPSDVALDQNGNIFFLQPYQGRVRQVEAVTGRITTVAGNGGVGFSGDGGPATEAKLHFPGGIAVDKTGQIYISDTSNGRVRRVDMGTGVITTVVGNGPILVDVIL